MRRFRAPFQERGPLVLTEDNLDTARQFIWRNARVIDRRRFAYLFEGGDAQPVVDALRAYRNADGGFGHALEPDGRGPDSQPLHGYVVLQLLDELGRFSDPLVAGLLDYFVSVTASDGGLPAVIPTKREYPHAPWWNVGDSAPRGSLLPTAGITGLLLKNRVRHSWVDAASAFCWDAVRSIEVTHPYEVEFALGFLDHALDRQEAERQAARLGDLVREQRLVVLDPETATLDMTPPGYSPGEYHLPLNYAPRPTSLARRWFSDEVIAHNLDLREQAQLDDGGWMFNWGQWNPAAVFEWRGSVTVETLAMLRAYGRMG
jgi:hypothetical protein